MKKRSLGIGLLLTGFALTLGAFLIPSSKAEESLGYSTSTLPTTIDLNDTSEANIRSYYSSLNSLGTNQRQGTNLLKNLKTILKNGQKYYSYDSGNAIWQIYEIADRDWTKSPASSTTYGTYNSTTNKITGYTYGTGSGSSAKNNPYIHALYINRDVTNQTTAWDDHQQTQWGINREHVWPKAEGFETSGAGGARGDPMHLMAGNGYANNIHSNYYYGYVKTSSSYTDCGSKYSNQSGNLRGTPVNAASGTVFEPQDCDKGDIARAIFYMVARYNYLSGNDSDGIDSNNPNLELTQNISDWASSGYSSTTSKTGKMGLLTDLLNWHHQDPVDAYEIHRNNLLYTNYTNNRNPFIDFPEWVDFIWGTATYSGKTKQSYSSSPTGYATPSSDTINGYNGGSSDPVSVTGVTLEKESTSIEVGGSEVLSHTITPSNATNQAVTWTSSNPNVATVSSSGRVEGVAEGSATITIRTTDGNYTDTCTVTVTAASSGGVQTESGRSDLSSATTNTGDSAWDITGANGYYKSDNGVKLDATNEYIFKNPIFSGDVSTYMTELTVTVNGRINGTASENNTFKVQALSSTGNVLAEKTLTGTSVTTTFTDAVFTLDENLSGCTGIKIIYLNKSSGNWGIKGVSWEASYSVPEEEITLSSIAIKTAPSKLTYTAGDGFAPAGLVITATYSDASTANISYDSDPDSFEFVPADNLQTSDTSVTISYGGKTCSQAITVNASKTLSSISLKDYTTSYYVDDEFSFDGVCTANYSDSSSEPVTPTSVTSPNMSTAGEKEITVSYTYGGTTKSAQYTITVLEGGSSVPGSYTWNLATTSYSAASTTQVTWDSDCASMVADKYNAGTNANNYLPPSYSSSRFYTNSKLTFTPKANYEIKSVVYTATSATYANAMKNSTWTNATAAVSSTTVTITPTDGNSAFFGVVSGTSGSTSVVVNYLYTPPAELSSITLDTTNVKTVFAVNDTFNYTGLVVTAHYNDATSAVVTPTSVSSPDMTSAGQKTVTVTYEENDVSKSGSYNITVSSNPTLSWTAPTINTYSGTTLTSTDANSWGVTYNNGSGSITYPTYGQFSVKLEGATISLPYTWQPGDDGKTLAVSYSSLTTTESSAVQITQSVNPIMKTEEASSKVSDLTFTAACGGSGTADDGKTWTVTSDGTESTFDSQNGKGIHYGTNSATVQYIKLTSNDFTSGKITKVEVNASTASGVSATVSVTVGGEAFGGDPQDLTTSAVPDNPYTFTGNVDADTIEVLITKPSKATKAIYCKSVKVTYTTSGSSVNIANSLDHIAAQRVAVKFAKAFNAAMDNTENCTTGLSSAWSTCSSAYSTFLTEAAALGSAEETYAKNLIKYATAQYSDDSGEACIERMLKTYEICVQKHGQSAFMSDLVTVGKAPTSINTIVLSNNVNLIVIVVLSLVVVASLGGYFYIRRLKQK